MTSTLPPWVPQGSPVTMTFEIPEQRKHEDESNMRVLSPWFAPPHVLRRPTRSLRPLRRWFYTLFETICLSPCAVLSFDRHGPTPQCYADEAKLVPHPTAADCDPLFVVRSLKQIDASIDSSEWPQARTVHHLTDGTAVKRIWDPDAARSEALNMAMISSCTSIPVPRLRHVVMAGDTTYLVMDHIEGENLALLWPRMSLWSRIWAVWTLRGYISQLRRLRRTVPGTLDGGRCNGKLFTDMGAGPFQSYEDMVAWFNHKLDVAQRMRKAPLNMPRFNANSPLVFTHLDLCPRNIMLARDGTLYVVDWETAGFYPTWAEYTTMVHQHSVPASWKRIVPLIAGWHKTMAKYIDNIGWALTIGAMV